MSDRSTLSRRAVVRGTLAMASACLLPYPTGAAGKAVAGFDPEPWFSESSGDLRKDLKTAETAGKFLALLWEQQGCHYCEELHQVNFQKPEIVALGKKHFHTIQMDLWGSRTFIDFDGEEREEADVASGRFVRATPVMLFFDGKGQEVFRMPGYAPPPLFMAVYQYVSERGYEKASLRQWLDSRHN